ERAHSVRLPYRGSFFLIDPLDGTKEFVAGRNEFTVNLALVANGTPLLGIVGAPALGLIWRGLVGRGAERLRMEGTSIGAAEPIHTRPIPKRGRRQGHGRQGCELAIWRRSGRLYHARVHRLGRSFSRERALLSEILLHGEPARVRLFEEAIGIGGKGVAVGLDAEQIEPLS